MKFVTGGVTAPRGFLAGGIKAGIKKSGNKDLGLIYSEVPCRAAAAFTTNRFAASPVKISKAHIRNAIHQAIVMNSGNANCGNGSIGDRDAKVMTSLTAKALLLNEDEVLVASTGIIGHYLPIANIKKGIPDLVSEISAVGGGSFAETIMTTDTVKKECACEMDLDGATARIGGSCKGVGMLYPEMGCSARVGGLVFSCSDIAGTLFLAGIGLSFWVVYIANRAQWWAVIPAGVLTTLSAVTLLSRQITGSAIGGVFFVGLGLTFVLVALLPSPQGKMGWAFIPAGILLVMGVFLIGALTALTNYVWALALIAVGVWLLFRALRRE